jgi:uncharacterized protein YndB with AHSA1/START domain
MKMLQLNSHSGGGIMAEDAKSKQTLTLPSEREILITRWFAAPQSLVWRAHTDPALIPQWWGPAIYTTTVETMDVRVGGKWRYVQVAEDGVEHAFRGEYKEVLPDCRLVYTFEYEPLAGHIILETATFAPMDNGTFVTMHALFDNQEDRDGMIASGMEDGQAEGWERLAALATALQHAEVPSAAVFELTRELDAPRHKVWQAWSEADNLAKWWGPTGLAMEHVTLNFAPGGMFHYGMRTPNGDMMWGRFIYKEIFPEERTTFINSFSDEAGGITRHPLMREWPAETLNELTLEAIGDRTRLTMRGWPINATVDEIAVYGANHASMEQGFGGTFRQLVDFLAQG